MGRTGITDEPDQPAAPLGGGELTYAEVASLAARQAARLDELGIGYLAEPYVLERADGAPLRVRIVEVSTEGIRVKLDDFGAIDGPRVNFDLSWPMPPELRTWSTEADAITAWPGA